MDQNNIIECGGFYFIHNFDSGNLGHVERVPTELIAPSLNSKTSASETPDYEFNMWTRPDCAGTEFENGNRTWFYFGIQATEPGVLVRLNLINLNKQGKMYNQGMAPVTRTLPGKPQWERIRDRPVHYTDDNTFTLSFKFRTAENLKATTFFAFTYPFSFAELQIALNSIDLKMLPLPTTSSPDDIYYCRECLIYSLEGRRVDLLTITSHHGITSEREVRLKNLFPDTTERPFKFNNKKVIFISARVHPGETPSSFVFNGFLNLLLNRNDPIAVQLRKLYVFKMVPFLNPDGVARGHYRTDTRGVNLNRVYLNPSLALHPTVYASRALIRYYHYGCEKEDVIEETKSVTSRSIPNINESVEHLIETKKKKGGGSTTSTIKGDYKRDKSKGASERAKSSTTIKQASFDSKRDSKAGLTGEAALLAEQVYDMKLQEENSQLSEQSSKSSNDTVEENQQVLNDNVLRACLGSEVHVSTSEELNLTGVNPLRPLRDTLKNSISLLMGSSSSEMGSESTSGKDSRLSSSNIRMGWCSTCRAAVNKLESTMPGITNIVPGYSAMAHAESTTITYHSSIDEYREYQRQQYESMSAKTDGGESTNKSTDNSDAIYFCTNCFKRYGLNDQEEIKPSDTASPSAEVSVSGGDNGDMPESEEHDTRAGSTGDNNSRSPSKEEPRKCPLTRSSRGKKPPPPPAVAPPAAVPPTAAPLTVPPPAVAPPAQPRPAYKEAESGLYLYVDLHGHASKKGPAKKPPPAVGAPAQSRASFKSLLKKGGRLYLYVDLHGHANKKGIFMYGNHFEDVESCVECMLLPRIMSLNNLHFHFSSCNFTERNMYLKDRRDGMSREGSGRVAVLKATGLVRSYTLECNYNTGRLVNVLPPATRDTPGPAATPPAPPKYTPHIFEEVGRSLGASILDLTGAHPNSRIPCSEHRNLAAVRDWLRTHTRTMRPQLTMSRLRPPKPSSPVRVPLYARSKAKVTEERKENTYVGAKTEGERRAAPVPAPPLPDPRYAKKNEPVKAAARARHLADSEPKPKSLAGKRRSVLGVRKPNASKPQVGARRGARRSADDGESPRASLLSAKLSKRSFARSTRCRAMASSSSEELGGAAWEARAPPPAKRRGYAPPAPAPSHLKKIRLKTGL